MEQLVILLVIGAISLINWLLQKSAEHKKRKALAGSPESPTPASNLPPWAGPDADEPVARSPRTSPDGKDEAEEQMRRFLEALGLPTPNDTTGEPEVVLPFEPEPPPLPSFRAQPAPPAPPQTAKRTLRQNRETRELAEQFELNAIDAASDTGTTAAFRELLEDPSTIRQGIILREILGPPKALEN